MNETKLWYQSKAVWGAIAALIATLARMSGHDPGLGSPEVIADALLNTATGIGALAALYGRLAATSRITG